MGLMDWHVSMLELMLKATIPLNPLEPVTVTVDCPDEPARISDGETATAEMEKSGGGGITTSIMFRIFGGLVEDIVVPVTLMVYDPGGVVESTVTVRTAGVEASMDEGTRLVVIPDGRPGATAKFTLPANPLKAFKLIVAVECPVC